MPQVSPLDILDDARSYLYDIDDELQARVLQAYKKAQAALEKRIGELARMALVAKDEGVPVGELFTEQRRLKELLNDIQQIIAKINQSIEAPTIEAKAEAVKAAAAQIDSVINGVPFRKSLALFPAGAISELSLLDSELLNVPIRRLFADIGKAAAKRLQNTLIEQVAIGAGENQITNAIRTVIKVSEGRARTIARTETLQAYRNAALKSFAGDKDYQRWVWVAARDRRTCVICWGLHGRVFKSNQKQISHPNCRCTLLPLQKGETPQSLGIVAGVKEFAGLPNEVKLDILGRGRFDAYEQGVPLSDMFQFVQMDWGMQPVIVPTSRL